MAQESIELNTTPPYSGAALVADLNGALQAIATDFAGPDDPVSLGGVGAYMTWADTGNSLFKRRNAANSAWVIEGVLFKQSPAVYAEGDIPTVDVGPIYVIGKGAYEWDGVSAYAPANVTVSSLNGGQLAGFRNKIINGNPVINQRGVSGTVVLAAGEYGHDRWKAGSGGCTYTFSASGGIVTIDISAGTLVQVIEGSNLQSGQHVLSWQGTAQARVDSGSYGDSGDVIGTAAAGTNQQVEFGAGTFTQVQYEFSAIPTSFEFRFMPDEEYLCRRYYQTSYVQADGLTENSIFGYGNVASSIAKRIGLIPDMQGDPSINIFDTNGNSNSVITVSSGGTATSRTPTIDRISKKSARVSVATSDVYIEFHYQADAEL